MACCKKNDNQTVLDFILNSPAPIYTSIKLRERYDEESQIQKDKSADFHAISKFCEVNVNTILYILKRNFTLNVDFVDFNESFQYKYQACALNYR